MENSPGVERHMRTTESPMECPEHRMESSEGRTESPEGGLKELVHRWFAETQASLVLLHNGNFPEWFQGFTARKDAEDLLRDKTLGCFLIRLSDKAIGYILSYKGQDRCRHFVINQNAAGLYLVSGDSQPHRSLPDLIQHYTVSPIQPFGEVLTSCCSQTSSSELYDVVKFVPQEKPAVSVRALRSLWDRNSHGGASPQHNLWTNLRAQPQNEPPTMPPTERPPTMPPTERPPTMPPTERPPTMPPTLPPKSKNRKLTGTASVGLMSQAEHAAPRRGLPLSYSLSGSLHENTSHHSHAHPDQHKAERLASTGNLTRVQASTGNPTRDERTCSNREDPPFLGHADHHPAGPSARGPPGASMYSELRTMETRSRSLPRLDSDAESPYSNHLGPPLPPLAPASRSPVPPKRVTCHTYSLQAPGESARHWAEAGRHWGGGGGPVELDANPLYQSSDGFEVPRPGEGEGEGEGEDNTYAEVPQGPTPPSRHLADTNTYEQILGGGADVQGNTYETLEELKSKQSKSTWGKSNIKWWKVFPEYKKK